jgi:hypothetical protein
MAKRKIEKTRARARPAERVTVFFFEPELALAILRPLDARTQVHGGSGAPPIRAALGAAAHWLRRTFMTGEEAHCLGCGRDITTTMPGRGRTRSSSSSPSPRRRGPLRAAACAATASPSRSLPRKPKCLSVSSSTLRLDLDQPPDDVVGEGLLLTPIRYR